MHPEERKKVEEIVSVELDCEQTFVLARLKALSDTIKLELCSLLGPAVHLQVQPG